MLHAFAAFEYCRRRAIRGALGALCMGLTTLGPGCSAVLAQQVTEFGTVPLSNVSAGGLPLSIVTGPDGNLWFAQLNGRIGLMTPSGSVTIFSAGISAAFEETVNIVAGPDGNLWFTEGLIDRIGRITPNGVVTEFPVPQGSRPAGLAVGADGNLWFTEYAGGNIARFTLTGVTTEFNAGMTPNSRPVGIVAGPDGNLWFTELRGNKIGRITTAGAITEFSGGLLSGQLPAAITAGPDGNLWFTDLGLNQIGQITTAGAITLFSSGISPGAQPNGITPGPDGNLWFTETGTGLIGRIATAGVVSEFSAGITPNSEPYGITAGPDGNLWFAEFASSFIGRISTGSLIPQTGYWWNPAEAGRGYNIEQRGNNLFMAAFLYDTSGRATWYGVGPGAMNGASYEGTLTSYANGQTLTGTYHPPMVIGPAGSFSVTFTSPTTGSIVWPGGTVPIQRFFFGTVSSAQMRPAGTPQAGWWWAPNEGGRGYVIEVQGGNLMLTGYMYDSMGNPIWYMSGPATLFSQISYDSVWQQFGNGQALTEILYYAPTVVNSDVGSVTLQFSSSTAGVLTLPNGRQIAIERFVF